MGWQKDDILEEARRKGIDTGNSDSQLDQLKKVAESVGMENFDGLSNEDTDELQRRLAEREEIQGGESEETEGVEEAFDENGEPMSEADKAGLKQGYGREEFAKTLNNSNYYKEQGEALRKRQEEAQRAKEERFKKKSNPDGDDDSSKKNGGDGLSKSERDEQGKSAKPADENEEKSRKERAQDRKNLREAKIATAQNKIDNLKSKAYQAAHPVEAAKAKAKAKAKNKIKKLLIKYWWVVAIAVLVLAILGMVMLLFLAMSADEASGGSQSYKYLEEQYDFTTTLVTVTTSDSTPVTFETRISLNDLVVGSVYYATMGKTDGLSNADLLELYSAYSVIFRTEALVLGGYDNKDKEITIKSGDDFPYCDPYNGCIKIKNGDKISYIPAVLDEETRKQIQGEIIEEYPPMDEDKLNLLINASEKSDYRLVTPKKFDEALTKANFDNPEFNQTIEDQIYEQVKTTDKSYITILREVYPDSQVYNINDYATEYTFVDSTSYWYPVGSVNPTSGDIYGGEPSIIGVTSEFGGRYIQGKYSNHKGVDLAGTANSTVIIATRGGKVTATNDGCPNNNSSTYGTSAGQCGGGYGNRVEIDHGDGTSSLYAHLTPGSLTVKVGDTVKQGQKIALMGSSGNVTGDHLHFEIRVNNVQVDPLKYISVDNPRPVSSLEFSGNYVQGESNKQSVCLTLKANGLSNNAIAAILSNMASESSFRTDGTGGDGGTSDGLCQWHNGRLTRLKSSDHCGSHWKEVGCQIEYLFWELKNEESSTYNELMSDHSAYDMAAYFCVHFERPRNKDACYSVRGVNARDTYLDYVKNGCKG